MSSLDMGGERGEPAAGGLRIERFGLWLMGAYWLALLAVGMLGAALNG